jgi:hypothetical protein
MPRQQNHRRRTALILSSLVVDQQTNRSARPLKIAIEK